MKNVTNLENLFNILTKLIFFEFYIFQENNSIMKICAISQYNPAVPLQKRADKKQLENHEQYLQDKNIRKYSSNYSNYVIPFTGEVKKNKLPDKLRVASIQDCQPVNDGDSQKDTERLSAVLSTALHYLTNETPVLLGASDRYQSQKFIIKSFSDDELFKSEQNIDNVIFVEDDRILDDPILFVKDEDGDICVIGEITIEDKETKGKMRLCNGIKMPIYPDEQNIRFNNTDIYSISLGVTPDKKDIQNIKMFPIKDVLGKEFPQTGNIVPGEFTTNISAQSEYTAGTYPMFSDIGGNKEAIQKIIENIYAPIVFPEVFGHVMTKGTILSGPPGTGKSMLGQALCNELSKRLGEEVHLQSISGAEMQISAVGGSEAKWRALFQEAIDNQPALILIDEIDACTPTRDGSSNARYDNSVVNQILSLMSNLEKSDHKVHIIGMTNRLEAIDPAMLRNGRFGVIEVPAPTSNELREIYDIISKNYKIDDSVDVDSILKRVINMKGTGSTVAGMLENAKKYSLRRNNVYKDILTTDVKKEDVDSCCITAGDLNKALDDEETKLKKAKIQSDRIVIKGFSK